MLHYSHELLRVCPHPQLWSILPIQRFPLLFGTRLAKKTFLERIHVATIQVAKPVAPRSIGWEPASYLESWVKATKKYYDYDRSADSTDSLGISASTSHAEAKWTTDSAQLSTLDSDTYFTFMLAAPDHTRSIRLAKSKYLEFTSDDATCLSLLLFSPERSIPVSYLDSHLITDLWLDLAVSTTTATSEFDLASSLAFAHTGWLIAPGSSLTSVASPSQYS